MELRERDWSISIGERGKKGKKIKGLRVVFSLNKNSSSTSNKGKVSIYNLSSSNKAILSQENAFFELEAGYIGNTGVIYSGDVTMLPAQRSGGDIITSFNVADGQTALEKAHLDKSYDAGTNINVIVNDLLKTLKDTGNVIVENFTSKNTTIEQTGMAISSLTSEALDDIFNKLGLTWSIQQNKVRIIEKAKSSSETKIILTSETGLIEVPQRTESGVNFKSLINTTLMQPGQKIHIKSKPASIDEVFTIKDLGFKGDTHGNNWYIIGEANRL